MAGFEWLVGVAAQEVTPPLGVWMTGYANRPGPAAAIHDPLYVRALAIVSGNERVVLVSLDLLGLDADLLTAIRDGLAVRCGLEPRQLLVNASHTHAGPATQTLRGLGVRDESYCQQVVDSTVDSVCTALHAREPVQLRFGTAPVRIGHNRRERSANGTTTIGVNLTGPYDSHVYTLRADRPDGTPLAVWFSHATHPVVLGNDNTTLSAEWPGAACRIVSAALGGCHTQFAQGCCGDINPVRRGGFAEVDAVGRELAEAALAAAEAAEPVAAPGLSSVSEQVRLALQVPTVDQAEAALQEHEAGLAEARRLVAAGEIPPHRTGVSQAMADWAADYLAAAHRGAPAEIACEVQAVRIGDVCLIGTAGETFIEIGQRLQAGSPWARTVALGYANGCIGYLPTEAAFPLGGYEVDTAYRYYGTLMVQPDSEARLLEAATRLMASLQA